MLAGIVSGAMAQQVNAQPREKMAPLLAWVGKWKGEGTMTSPTGEKSTSSVDETIETKLENTLLVLEGIGKKIDPATKTETIVHHAYGIISFDPYTNQYKLKTWLHDGKSGEGWFNVISANNYQWGFDNPRGGKTRYTILLDPEKKTWNEYGEYSKDGAAWSKFFEMNLTKVE